MRKKILIVEDNEDLALAMTIRLAAAGFEVRAVTTAPEAIKAVDIFEPDLVLLDLLVPEGGGYAVLKALRASPHTGSVPVIVMTGIEDEEYKRRIRALGVSAFLEKPCEPGSLIQTMNDLVDAPRIEERILVKSRSRRGARAPVEG